MKFAYRVAKFVLILVLVDVGLGLVGNLQGTADNADVLILVLVDVGLGLLQMT